MGADWKSALGRLRKYPVNVHVILPPCPADRISAVEIQLGKMPEDLRDMLRHFNGAKLFIKAGPLMRIFGISTDPTPPDLEWGADCHIEKYVPRWRHAAALRDKQWPIAITNYGGLIVMHEGGLTKQWDTSQGIWEPMEWQFAEWVEHMLGEGDAFMNEE